MKNFKERFLLFKNDLSKALFPPSVTCDVCGYDIFEEKSPAICEKCQYELPYLSDPCKKCGKELLGKRCNYCYYHESKFTNAYAVFAYKEPVSPMIFRFKYNKEFHLKHFFTFFLVMKYSSLSINADCVVGVPMHPDKEILRVKNQATLLAEEFSKITHVENASDKIIKIEQITQTNLNPDERQENVKNSLIVEDKQYFKGKSVLVIDDIFTTGATANAMAEKLFACKAKAVYILTICTS